MIEEPAPSGSLLLMIPGMFGTAEDCAEEFAQLKDYPVAAMSLRGRGQSSEFSSYSFTDHVSDIVAVLDEYPEKKVILLAHSFGVLAAVAAAEQRKAQVSGLILVDKGLKLQALTEKWWQRVLDQPPKHTTLETAKKVFDELKPLDLTELFLSLKIPTLVFKGEHFGHALTGTEAAFLEKLDFVKMVRLKKSGHWPIKTDYPIFISEIKKFIDTQLNT